MRFSVTYIAVVILSFFWQHYQLVVVYSHWSLHFGAEHFTLRYLQIFSPQPLTVTAIFVVKLSRENHQATQSFTHSSRSMCNSIPRQENCKQLVECMSSYLFFFYIEGWKQQSVAATNLLLISTCWLFSEPPKKEKRENVQFMCFSSVSHAQQKSKKKAKRGSVIGKLYRFSSLLVSSLLTLNLVFFCPIFRLLKIY